MEKVFFSATSDVGFAKLFGTEGNEELLRQLLSSIIRDKDIVVARHFDTAHAVNAEASSRFDVYCQCSDGERFIVEMQKRSYSTFMNRALAYSAMAILDQARKNWNYDFKKVYFIGILDYVHFGGRDQAITRVSLQTEDDHIVTNENYLQVFVELPKLAADGTSFGDKFLRAVRDVGDWDRRPEGYEDSEYDVFFESVRLTSLHDDELNKYNEEMSTEQDYKEYLDWQVELARKAGIEEGREEGARQAALETARKMLAKEIPVNIVSECTGLSEAELRAL